MGAAAGGIREQIEHGSSGVLVSDATDLERFGAVVVELLADPARRQALGAAGRQRVAARYLHDRLIADWTSLLARLLCSGPMAAADARSAPSNGATVATAFTPLQPSS